MSTESVGQIARSWCPAKHVTTRHDTVMLRVPKHVGGAAIKCLGGILFEAQMGKADLGGIGAMQTLIRKRLCDRRMANGMCQASEHRHAKSGNATT